MPSHASISENNSSACFVRQARFDYKARKAWELEQAQKKAMSLHHRQMERATNRCVSRMTGCKVHRPRICQLFLRRLVVTANPGCVS